MERFSWISIHGNCYHLWRKNCPLIKLFGLKKLVHYIIRYFINELCTVVVLLLGNLLIFQPPECYRQSAVFMLELAKKYHPDANNNNPSAKRKFQEIRDAHETLRDSEKRANMTD